MSRPPLQRDTNPFPFSDTNKRYHTFDYYLRRRFGKKCAKVPLDGGFTCPNIDGTCGVGGCIYCLGGSAAVTAVGDGIEAQYAEGLRAVRGKWEDFYTIPYLQAHTCTYDEPSRLRELYLRCQGLPGAVMLAIGTRADCLGDGVLRVLEEVSGRMPIIVELGLQSASDATASLINRGHTLSEFEDGYRRLRSVGGDISVCIHLIDGLPGEGTRLWRDSAAYVASLAPDMVKLHLMHVLRGTALSEMYHRGEYTPPQLEEYVAGVVEQLELLPPATVIARLTGDGPRELLEAPLWSLRKKTVMNAIDRALFLGDTYQGRLYIR